MSTRGSTVLIRRLFTHILYPVFHKLCVVMTKQNLFKLYTGYQFCTGKLVFSGHPKRYLHQTSQTAKMNRLKKVLWATKKLAQKIHADNSLLLKSG